MTGFEKEEEVESMWEWISRSLKKTFVDNIPVEDVKVGMVSKIIMICVLYCIFG